MRGKWRLPTIDELSRMFDREKGKPKISGFNSDDYWGSTTYAYKTGVAWVVDFDNGHTDYYDKSFTFCVRCVRETETGDLIWSESSESAMSWDKANQYCNELNIEWKLPTIMELQGMFDYDKGGLKINGFVSKAYWSSTIRADNPHMAWFINFNSGYTNSFYKYSASYVRCVKRIKKGKLEWSESSKTEVTWDKANKYCNELHKKESNK